ncbi:hypothetical protein CB0940_06600 [Cercospora beticola]|uniref:Uncharacterized protein n=1 Tax=Cercospora beticola TaxID=122368 RepID=A0A2G5I0L7_CERBT|nr:hypothetical protein CB0940_06600 [Cercospora beticola]PIA98339.1 hypothetical protein CB0940_06600 [Cercospora beticola]WPA99249.1 hypothetical protein RHO25_003865 [Cercospora beticola]
MAAEYTQQKQPRKRYKTHGWFDHGNFDHGESSHPPRHIRFADRPQQPGTRRGFILNALDKLNSASKLALGIVGFILLSAPVLVILSKISLFGMQSLCQKNILPQGSGLCDHPWTKPSTPVLPSVPVGKTPLTTTFDQLLKLNEISPSLAFLSMPLFMIKTNLSTILPAIQNDLPGTNVDALRKSSSTAFKLVEQFSTKDNEYRQSSLIWNVHGIADFSSSIEQLRTAIPAHSDFNTWSTELLNNNIPFKSDETLNYQLLSHYDNFIMHQLPYLENLVFSAGETKLAIQELLGRIGKLETELIKSSHYAHAEPLSIMRLSANWTLEVVTRAEHHYRNLSSTLFSLFKRLGPEMESYENWWGLFASRNAVSVSRLREIVVAESGLLEELFAKAMPVQDAVQRVVDEFMRDEDEAQKKILWKLEEAARKGTIEDIDFM